MTDSAREIGEQIERRKLTAARFFIIVKKWNTEINLLCNDQVNAKFLSDCSITERSYESAQKELAGLQDASGSGGSNDK